MKSEVDNYEDIINLPHHVSLRHPQMNALSRAAQFAPYAALTGYGDAIDETARVTDEKIEIDEELKKELDRKIQIIKEKIKELPQITFTYFISDMFKQGGSYILVTGNVKKIDENDESIILTDGSKIKIDDIIEMQGEIIKEELL